jgi:hypothetical protein
MVGALKSALFSLALVACSAPAGRVATPAPPEPKGKLVVLVVIDQWPEWSFEAKRAAFHGGFERLLEQGEWRVGRYPSAATLTGPDHALLGTGEPPARSGIVADEWYHRDTKTVLEAVHAPDGSISARWLKVPGMGDAVEAARRGGKAVDVALKPRAAILPLGHRGLSIWYDPATAAWATFQPPAWLGEWNRAHPISDHLHDVWTPLDPARIAELAGVPDDQLGEVGSEGFGPTFPHDPQKTKQPAKAVLAMPLGNELVLDLATHAIEAEQLGRRKATDLLVIGLSAHDYVGHGWGHESWEQWDLELRLDARLGQLLDDLDRLVGANQWSMIVTADHGGSPLPERLGGGRLTHSQIRNAANNAASAVLGEGTWIADSDYPNIFFTQAMLSQPASELASASKRVQDALRSFPGIERVGRVADFAGHCETRTGEARALCQSFDTERSGDLFYMLAKGWILQEDEEHAATAHGSLHDYDMLVPVIELAPGRARHAPANAPSSGEVDMLSIAPLLASWLGVAPPATLQR